MFAQKRASDVLEKFLKNKECLKDFVDNLEISKYKDDFISASNDISAELFKDNELCIKAQNMQDEQNLQNTVKCNANNANNPNKWHNNDLHIDGFVIKYKHIEILTIIPESKGNYLKFWGYRNFFVYSLARWHSFVNDKIKCDFEHTHILYYLASLFAIGKTKYF